MMQWGGFCALNQGVIAMVAKVFFVWKNKCGKGFSSLGKKVNGRLGDLDHNVKVMLLV